MSHIAKSKMFYFEIHLIEYRKPFLKRISINKLFFTTNNWVYITQCRFWTGQFKLQMRPLVIWFFGVKRFKTTQYYIYYFFRLTTLDTGLYFEQTFYQCFEPSFAELDLAEISIVVTEKKLLLWIFTIATNENTKQS